MEFRYPTAVTQANAMSLAYLTEHLMDSKAGVSVVEELIGNLGNAIDDYPDWHPIASIPLKEHDNYCSVNNIDLYEGVDHTRYFVRGFVTCPYGEENAEKLVKSVNQYNDQGLYAYRLDTPLYSDKSYPVVVEARNVVLEGDGTIRSRDALAWFVQDTVRHASSAQVAETWWNIRRELLGAPHGSRSSILVNQHTGGHMRKILEAFNNSGMFGPIKESSLAMLSKKKRDEIGSTLLKAVLNSRSENTQTFEFELRGERINAEIRDTWNDGEELSIRAKIGKDDLYVSGFYYPKKDILETSEPKGKRGLAEKFL
jgi:hypothetical protein